MRINWDLMNPAKPPPATRAWRFIRRMFTPTTAAPLHMSNHYNRDHFTK